MVDHPDLEETDVIKEAMGRFRTLSAEERLVRDTEREGGMKGEGGGGCYQMLFYYLYFSKIWFCLVRVNNYQHLTDDDFL